MEDVSDQQPEEEKLTYTYDRDFLLQFQTNPMCLEKPDGLPDLEVVLVQARAPSKPGFQQNRCMDARFPQTQEMEDVSDQQPEEEKLTYTYDRDFLLQFQTNPMCLEKPDGLPDLEVVLVQARAPSKPGFQQNRQMASEPLECSICCEKFDDQQHCPRLLPGCGHSFCTSCLRSLLKKNTINCPTCRSTVSASAGLATLPKNFALLDILLTLPQKENDGLQLCDTCDDEKHPASSCCLNCKEYMCKDAAHFHTRQKATRDHCVVSLEELKANPKLEAASDVFCPEHNDQFRFFDEDCGHVVCRDCVTLKHHGHKCLSLADAASKYRQKMDELSNKGITLAEKIKAGEFHLKEATNDLKRGHTNTAALIQSTFKELHEALTARETVLMSELDNLYKAKDLILTEQRDRLCLFQACLDSGIQRAKTIVQSSGNVELLAARTDIVSTLEALESQPPVLDPQANSILDFSVDLKKLRDVLSEAGFVSDKSACVANTTASGQFGLSVVKSEENAASFTFSTCNSIGRVSAWYGKAKLNKGNLSRRDRPRPGAIPKADKSWTTVGRDSRNVSVDPRKFQNIKRRVDYEDIFLRPRRQGYGYGAWARGRYGAAGPVDKSSSKLNSQSSI